MSQIDEENHATFTRLSQRFGIPMPQDAWDRAKAGIPSGPGISYSIDDDDGPTHHDWDDAVHAYLDACEEIPEGPVEIQPCKAPEVTEKWMREEAARAAGVVADDFAERFTCYDLTPDTCHEQLRQRIEDAITLALALTIKPSDVNLAEGFGKPYVMPEEDVVSLWCAELVEAFDEDAAMRALEVRAAKRSAIAALEAKPKPAEPKVLRWRPSIFGRTALVDSNDRDSVAFGFIQERSDGSWLARWRDTFASHKTHESDHEARTWLVGMAESEGFEVNEG